ncbi:hypothetical protein [Streptomyces sp. MK37H]|nr:hypothetical protein [Streptomyces sp. MK37H]
MTLQPRTAEMLDPRRPGVLAAERKERARIRSKKSIRWGGRPLATRA